MLRQHRTITCLLGLTILLMLLSVLSGCGGPTPTPTPTPEAIGIAATPVVIIIRNPNITEVTVGQEVALSAEATGGPNLKFEWIPKKGKVSNTEGPSTIYTAPDASGIDTVDVIVTSDGGTTTKTVTFTVVVPPTPTSTLTPTATPTSTVTDTVTPTGTSTSTPTETPVCATPSPGALPPLTASATEVNAICVDKPPEIDGCLDEDVWSQAQPLTYAEHPYIWNLDKLN